MNFSESIARFAGQAPGTDSFLDIKNAMQLLIQQDPAHASGYFLIYGFARAYVLLYEDQGIAPEFAQAAKQQLLSYMQRLEQAFSTNDAGAQLEALNWIVNDYHQSDKIF